MMTVQDQLASDVLLALHSWDGQRYTLFLRAAISKARGNITEEVYNNIEELLYGDRTKEER